VRKGKKKDEHENDTGESVVERVSAGFLRALFAFAVNGFSIRQA
jgi:hypothetical protein